MGRRTVPQLGRPLAQPSPSPFAVNKGTRAGTPAPHLTATPEDAVLIRKIIERAKGLVKERERQDPDWADMKIDWLSLAMDITACHLNGCPLRLEQLLAFADADFGHDVFGIRRYMNRATGHLLSHFRPRCAKSEAEQAREAIEQGRQ